MLRASVSDASPSEFPGYKSRASLCSAVFTRVDTSAVSLIICEHLQYITHRNVHVVRHNYGLEGRERLTHPHEMPLLPARARQVRPGPEQQGPEWRQKASRESRRPCPGQRLRKFRVSGLSRFSKETSLAKNGKLCRQHA